MSRPPGHRYARAGAPPARVGDPARRVASVSARWLQPADFDDLRIAARSAPSVSQLDLVSGVSAVLPVHGDGDIAVLDCGAKWNILRSLERRGVAPRVYDWSATADDILATRAQRHPDLEWAGRSGPASDRRRRASEAGPVRDAGDGHLPRSPVARPGRGRHDQSPAVRPSRRQPPRARPAQRARDHHHPEPRVPGRGRHDSRRERLRGLAREPERRLGRRPAPPRAARFCVQYHPEGCPGPQDSQQLFDDFPQSWRRDR